MLPVKRDVQKKRSSNKVGGVSPEAGMESMIRKICERGYVVRKLGAHYPYSRAPLHITNRVTRQISSGRFIVSKATPLAAGAPAHHVQVVRIDAQRSLWLVRGDISCLSTGRRRATRRCREERISGRLIAEAPFTRYNLLSNRLSNRFDNRLYRVNGV